MKLVPAEVRAKQVAHKALVAPGSTFSIRYLVGNQGILEAQMGKIGCGVQVA